MAYILSLLLALLGQPLSLLPDKDNPFVAIIPPVYMAPPLVARTSRDGYILRGPVSEVRMEMAELFRDEPSKPQPLQAMRFDTHGNLTKHTYFTSSGEQGSAAEACITLTYANQYDEQGRLQQVTLTAVHEILHAFKIEATRTYDAKGRLSGIHAIMSTPNATEQLKLEIPITTDDQGRITEYRMQGDGDTKEPSTALLRESFQYPPNGGLLVETYQTIGRDKLRSRFDQQGRLVELQRFDPYDKVDRKSFLQYSEKGDPVRFSVFESDEWIRLGIDDYIYDAHGNWTARTLYLLEQINGKAVRAPFLKQVHTLTYHKEQPAE